MSNQNDNLWTYERVQALRALYAKNLSSRLIAEEIGAGLTRSAVIGKIRRMGLHREGGVIGKDGRTTLAPRLVKAPRKVTTRQIGTSVVIDADGVTPLHVSLLDLRPNQCRYPYGDGPFTFCGCPSVAGLSYCEPHQRLTRISAQQFEVAA